MVGAWMYDEKYLNEDFNYEDVESKWEASTPSQTAEEVKQEIDAAHKK